MNLFSASDPRQLPIFAGEPSVSPHAAWLRVANVLNTPVPPSVEVHEPFDLGLERREGLGHVRAPLVLRLPAIDFEPLRLFHVAVPGNFKLRPEESIDVAAVERHTVVK